MKKYIVVIILFLAVNVQAQMDSTEGIWGLDDRPTRIVVFDTATGKYVYKIVPAYEDPREYKFVVAKPIVTESEPNTYEKILEFLLRDYWSRLTDENWEIEQKISDPFYKNYLNELKSNYNWNNDYIRKIAKLLNELEGRELHGFTGEDYVID